MSNNTFNGAPPVHERAAPAGPVNEADLHAYVDQQLAQPRLAEVQAYLQLNPQQAGLVRQWQQDAEALRALLAPVLAEPLPPRLVRSQTPLLLKALPQAAAREWRSRHQWPHPPVAAAAALLVVALLGAGGGWYARGWAGAVNPAGADRSLAAAQPLTGFVQRAAVAHAVYSPEVRRPVEVGADQEQQLVTWLSKRLGVPLKAPALAPLGYQLVGGRLLPGEAGAVAQFMYQDGSGQRLTLYVSREVTQAAGQPRTAFEFAQVGPTQVFYWVDHGFGYALSGGVPRETLQQVSQEVYRQLAAP